MQSQNENRRRRAPDAGAGLHEHGRGAQGRIRAETGHRVGPGRLQAYVLLGGLYAAQNRLDEARAQFENVVKQNPKSVPAQTMVGMLLEAQGKSDGSRACVPTGARGRSARRRGR